MSNSFGFLMTKTDTAKGSSDPERTERYNATVTGAVSKDNKSCLMCLNADQATIGRVEIETTPKVSATAAYDGFLAYTGTGDTLKTFPLPFSFGSIAGTGIVFANNGKLSVVQMPAGSAGLLYWSGSSLQAVSMPIGDFGVLGIDTTGALQIFKLKVCTCDQDAGYGTTDSDDTSSDS